MLFLNLIFITVKYFVSPPIYSGGSNRSRVAEAAGQLNSPPAKEGWPKAGVVIYSDL
jgi:hypothetical protein